MEMKNIGAGYFHSYRLHMLQIFANFLIITENDSVLATFSINTHLHNDVYVRKRLDVKDFEPLLETRHHVTKLHSCP